MDMCGKCSVGAFGSTADQPEEEGGGGRLASQEVCWALLCLGLPIRTLSVTFEIEVEISLAFHCPRCRLCVNVGPYLLAPGVAHVGTCE